MIKNSFVFGKNVKYFHTNRGLLWNIPKCAELDTDYLCDEKNIEGIAHNIRNRKGVGDIKAVHELKFELDKTPPDEKRYETFRKQLYEELFKIPNKTHPEVSTYGEEPKLVKYVNSKRDIGFTPKEFHEITKRLNLVRTDQLGNVCGNRSYYLLGEMAELEQALVSYFLEKLVQKNFQLVSVPDILPRDIIERCGMNTKGERNQVISRH